MTLIDEKIIELEEIKENVDLSHKRARKNQVVLQEICDEVIDAPLASTYFSKKVSNYLAYSSFDGGFSKVNSEDGIFYISNFGDEISFKPDENGMSILYRSNDGKKSFRLYKKDSRGYVETIDESKKEDGILSKIERIYDIGEEPVFKRERKSYVLESGNKKTVLVDLLDYNNGNLLRDIVSSTTIDGNETIFKYSKIIDPSRYEIKDGDLYIISEDESKIIEKSADDMIKLLKF